MKPRIRRWAKRELFRHFVPAVPLLNRISATAAWSKVAMECKAPIFSTRGQLYAFVNDTFFNSGNTPMDYFEFGVYQGASIKEWTRLNGSQQSRFFGFDSFEGLPEHWSKRYPRGTFDVKGELPQIDDMRAEFFKGWFQDTLLPFLATYRRGSPIVINNDSDLYSSTLFCLATMNPLILPGTIILFDEFFDPLHEFRALTDYANAFLREYRIVAATERFMQAAVEIAK